MNSMYNNESEETTRVPSSNSNVMHINVKAKDEETAIDRRKSAHRNRTALDSSQSANFRLPSATGRAPPNRLPPIRNLQDSNL